MLWLFVVCLLLAFATVPSAQAQTTLTLEAEATLVPPYPTPVAAPGAAPGSVTFGTTFSTMFRVCFVFHFITDLLDPGDSLIIEPYGFGFQNVFSTPQQDRTICVQRGSQDPVIQQFLDGTEQFAIRMTRGSVIIGALKVTLINAEPSSPVVYTVQGPPSQTVPAGGTLRFDVNFTAYGDAAAPPVTVSATSVVPNSTVTVNPIVGFPTFTSTVELVTTASTPPGFYWVVVTGRSGVITRSVNVSVRVTSPPTPPAPMSLTLSPKTATNTVGTQHTVTATVKDSFGNPTPGIVVRFSVSGANSASGMNVTNASGQASFTYTGTVAGGDTISAFADTNANGSQNAGEPSDTATKTWTPGPPATLTLAPKMATNTVGEMHCVTAMVEDAFGNPVPGVTVRFSVPTAVATHASPASGSATTNANGQATFCYSASLPGEDMIHAFADSDNDGGQDAGEPFDEATKTWILPPSTAFCEVKITQGGWIVANNGDRASFGGNAKVEADGSTVQGQENYQDHGPAQPRHVKSIELTAVTCTDDLTMATIFGRATIDGSGSFVFRIDVTDQGEPGRNDSYGIVLSDGYASGQQQLQGGNVQIHKT